MTTERKRGDKGAPRTELVGIRFDPRTRYLIEIAARAQRRSIANFVEWAVGESLKAVTIRNEDGSGTESVADAGNRLWDVDKRTRLLILDCSNRELLTFDEDLMIADIERQEGSRD